MTSLTMAKYELTKSIEARKVHKRTGSPTGEPWVTIPFGSIIDNVSDDREMAQFTYLGERYQSHSIDLKGAVRAV